MVTLDSYWARIIFLRNCLKETRERQFLIVLFIEFQIIGPWVLIVFLIIIIIIIIATRHVSTLKRALKAQNININIKSTCSETT